MHDLTSRMLNVEGYRKKNEMKLSTQTSSWTPGALRAFQRGVPEYLWLIKYTSARAASGRLTSAKMTRYALGPMRSSPAGVQGSETEASQTGKPPLRLPD